MFVQDWRVTPKLTLHLGLRYSLRIADQISNCFSNWACGISGGQREATNSKLALDLNMKAVNYVRSDKRHDRSDLLILKFVAGRAEMLPQGQYPSVCGLHM